MSFEFFEGQDDIRVIREFEEFLMIGELQISFWCLNEVYRIDMADVNQHEQVTLTNHIDPGPREYKRCFITDHKDRVDTGQQQRQRLRNGRQQGSHEPVELNLTCDGRFREVQVVSE
jgi:hypothetical protein